VHCSVRPEPFGLVVAEAMAQGRAVVAFDAGGPGEMIESGVSGRLVAPGDTDALASAISDLLARPDLRARLGEAARRRARHFSVAAMVQRMHGVYDTVLAGRRP
jgi:glycosyltransferase involved in cell wall biosynthesis